ncbi:tetratricopeptide repeat protein [Breznakiellaceae bacterium SP9]
MSSDKMPKALSKLEGTPFTNFSKPYLDFIAKGKLFGLVYTVMAVLNLLLPFVIIYKVVDSGYLMYVPGKIIFALIFVWIVMAFACWIGFQVWWDRSSRIKALEDSEFAVTFIFSDIIQTLGEWLGTLIGIIGVGVGIIAVLFLGEYASYVDDIFRRIGMGFMPSGILAVFAGPLTGFIIMILFRFIAEQLRLFCALVNNTKCIAGNIKELNTSYENTSGLTQDTPKAAGRYKIAAPQEDAKAQYNPGLTQDTPKTVEEYEEAARQGDAKAQAALGLMYTNGNGVTKDMVKAAGWLEKAALQGEVNAQYYLGLLYEKGVGVVRDATKAAEWYEEAARQGHAKAQASLNALRGN